jgi:hypothetical protein
MKLHMIDHAKAERAGALCLDGTAPGPCSCNYFGICLTEFVFKCLGFYFSHGSRRGTHDFLIMLQGGGWCYTLEQCYYRAYLDPKGRKYGSTRNWASEMEGMGPLSSDSTTNPTFHDYNRVYIGYCDGGSFHGHSAPKEHNGRKLYFAGKKILKIVIKELKSKAIHNPHNSNATAQQNLTFAICLSREFWS